MLFPRLKTLRLEYHLTQKEVADAISVSTSTYRRIEKGSGSLKLDPLVKLVKLYGVSADYLAGRTDNRNA